MADPGAPRDRVDGSNEAALREVLAQHPLRLAVAFGSRVRGRAFAWSDLDIAVQFEPEVAADRRRVLLDRLAAAIEDITDAPRVDVADLDAMGPHRAYRALHDGVLLHGTEEDRVAAEARSLVAKLDFDRVRETWQAGLRDRIEGGEYGRA